MTEEAKFCVKSCRDWYQAFANLGEGEKRPVKELLTTADLIESLSEQLEHVTRERDAAVNELVKLEYPIPCESDELGGSEYCEENCRFKYPQKECWLLYFRERGVEVE